jgi:hypothetical protein
MIAATSHRRATSEIVNALQTAVKAVKIPATQAAPAAAAFGNVELFDSENLVEVFQYLLITAQRVCVIVPLDEKFDCITEQRLLRVKRALPVALLISDRVLGNRKAALYGDDSTPGAFGLAELVLPAVTGLLLPNPNGVISEPQNTSIMSLNDTAKKLPNRITVVLELQCRGGWIEAPLAKGNVL